MEKVKCSAAIVGTVRLEIWRNVNSLIMLKVEDDYGYSIAYHRYAKCIQDDMHS